MTTEERLYRVMLSENKPGTVSTPWIDKTCASLLDPTMQKQWGADGPALLLTNSIGRFVWIDERGWHSEGGGKVSDDWQQRLAATVAKISAVYTPDISAIPMADQIAAAEARHRAIAKQQAESLARMRRRNNLIDHPM